MILIRAIRGSLHWLLTRYVFWFCFVVFFVVLALTKSATGAATAADTLMNWITVILGTVNFVIWRRRSKPNPSEDGAASPPPSSSASDSVSTS